ncbi:Werner Syndrome-like exonuclease isoform X1 [Triticum dicoccoides]|uniref:Werner Syndrome-like exonuclease isoform X1 n=1 Tax=Triticum dicoccoides TaxID=85692 RepID=UPI00188DEC55|nr:Werner Syndrome-like exonuclease isoform X1 [Triticum dicoccoides]
MESGAPPALPCPVDDDDDDFYWDAEAEAELQAIEAAYAAESAKRRRLPDWSKTPAAPAPVRPRPNPAPAAASASSPSWVLSPPTCQGSVKARYQQVAFSGKIVYCRTAIEVEKATREIVRKIESMKASGQVSLGFDLEWKPFPRRGEPPCKVALMQLCMDKTHCYLMHIIHSGVPPILKSLLEDSSSVKVGVCIDNDARKMFNDYEVRVQPLMDLSTVANVKLAGPYKRWSLAALTEMITCKELPKPGNIRMGNWESFVLSKKQLEYAATDAYISWYLYEVLRSLPDYTPDIETEVV